MFKEKKTLLAAIFFLGFFLLVYFDSFGNFFSQDDFYHLALSRLNKPLDVLNFFNPIFQKDVHFRPLGTQVFFSIAHVFSQTLAPLILRLVALGFHLANFYLVFHLLKKFLKKEFLAMVLAGVYLIAPLHFMSIYYISAFQQILAAFWQLAGFWFFALGKKRYVYLCFVLALLSKETAIVFPVLLLIFSYTIRLPKNLTVCLGRPKKEFSYWWPFLFLLITYGLVRLVMPQHDPGVNYQLSLSPRTLISSWRWYLVWLIGAPETITRYAGRVFDFNLISFLKDSGSWGRIFLVVFLAEIALLCLVIALGLKKKRTSAKLLRLLAYLGLFGPFFIASLLPVSFFPYHRYAHYLDLNLFYLLLVGGIVFLKLKMPKILWVLLLTLFLANTYSSVAVDKKLHWTTARSQIAREYFWAFQEEDLCRQEGVYFINTPILSAHEANIALFNHWGPAYFCRYQSMPPVYYQGLNPPSEKDQFKIVRIK